MKVELTKKEFTQAVQEYLFKKLGDTSYVDSIVGISGFSGDRYEVDFDTVEVRIKE